MVTIQQDMKDTSDITTANSERRYRKRNEEKEN
jgi:hypothetical protein